MTSPASKSGSSNRRGWRRRRQQRSVVASTPAGLLVVGLLASLAAVAFGFRAAVSVPTPARRAAAGTTAPTTMVGRRGTVAVGAGGGGAGGGDKERMARLMRIKKLKDSGGSYESLLDEDKGGSSSSPALAQEQDYMDLLINAATDDEGAGQRGEAESGDDPELHAELRRQEKQALVDKILKAKNKAQQQQQQAKSGGGGGGAGAFGVPNKGQPSPYLQRKLEQQASGSASAPPPFSAGGSERFPETVETYNPQSVSWGLYARPKNIPEAFGGQRIPEGGVSLEGDEEWLQKYEDIKAQVKEFKREAEGMVLTPLEKEDEPRIQAARQQARGFMLRGEYEAAVNVLAPWRPKCSVRSQLGCQTLMDLAVAYEAVYDFDQAQEIYRLMKGSPVKEYRSKAKALNLGAEAMRRMNLGSKSNVNPRNLVNFAYIPAQLEGSYGLYMKSRGSPDLDDDDGLLGRKAAVGSVAEALELLEDAVIAQGVGVRMDMVNAALRALHGEMVAADDRAAGSGAAPLRALAAEELDGRWRCRLTSHQESVDFLTKVDVWQRIESGEGQVTGQLPINPFEVIRSVKTAFTWEGKARVLTYGSEAGGGFLGLPSGLPHTQRVLNLGDSMMVTVRCTDGKGGIPRDSYEARFAVWTRAANSS